MRKLVIASAFASGLVACGGGGGSPPAPPPPRAAAVQSFSSPVASQAAAGQSLMAFRASMLAAAIYPVQISFTITGGAGGTSCTSGIDFLIPATATLSATPGATTTTGILNLADANASRQINLLICPGASTSDKVLSLAWSDASVAPNSNASGTIRGSGNTTLTKSKRLNDTGITQCASGTETGLACPVAGFGGQDGETGRDANSAITGAGANRTSAFILTALPSANCVQDSVNGLTWEGKTSSGLHAAANTYTWLSNAATNGGAVGTASSGVCTGSGCDTEKFVAAVNAEALCGFTDWRLPLADELANIVDSGTTVAPTINAQFANQAAATYWTGSPKSGDNAGAWSVDFNSGAITALAKSSGNRVRLVRGR